MQPETLEPLVSHPSAAHAPRPSEIGANDHLAQSFERISAFKTPTNSQDFGKREVIINVPAQECIPPTADPELVTLWCTDWRFIFTSVG